MQMERDELPPDSPDFPFSVEDSTVPDRAFEPASSSGFSSCTRDHSPSVRFNCIEHPVSKLDTLAGIAIKYGVEVSDVKRMNGLVTDHQMFAFKTLQIPLPGRHSPSASLATNGSAETGGINNRQRQHQRSYVDSLESFQWQKLKPRTQRISSAMNQLQGYYGLTPSNGLNKVEGTEMTVYKRDISDHSEVEQLPKISPASEPLPSRHHRSRSLLNGFRAENGDLSMDFLAEAAECETDKSNDFSIRRRQKVWSVSASPAPDLIMKEDNSPGCSGRTGSALAQRPKSASRYSLTGEDGGGLNLAGESPSNGTQGFRKSSSTSNLQASDSGPSIWLSTKWPLRLDSQSLSSTSVARPIFDGLPKPATSRRNKAALD